MFFVKLLARILKRLKFGYFRLFHVPKKNLVEPQAFRFGGSPNLGAGQNLVGVFEEFKGKKVKEFTGSFSSETKIFVLSESKFSGIGAYSVFKAWVDNLRYLGFDATLLEVDSGFKKDFFSKYESVVIILSDHDRYINCLDFEEIYKHRKNSDVRIYMSASSIIDGNSDETERLERAEQLGVSKFFSFRSEQFSNLFLNNWIRKGYEICHIPFAANLFDFKLIDIQKTYDFCFLASSNPDKRDQYYKFLKPIFSTELRGAINGPGWGNAQLLERCSQSFLYSASKVGLNLHIPISLNTHSEINERAYILSLLGMLQVTDKPIVLPEIFNSECIFSTNDPGEYMDNLFSAVSMNEQMFEQRVELMKLCFDKHTYLDRMYKLVREFEIK